MGISTSKCVEVDYELHPAELCPLDIISWSLNEPPPGAQTEFTLADLQAANYSFPMDVNNLPSDTKFVKRVMQSRIQVSKDVRNVRIAASMDLNGDAFEGIQPGSIVDIDAYPCHWKITEMGDLQPGERLTESIVYPMAALVQRVIFVLILDGNNRLLLKAKLLLQVPERCRGPFEALDREAMAEREARLRNLIMSTTSPSFAASPFFSLYQTDALASAIASAQAVRKPPIRYILANDGTKLAFRAYEPSGGGAKATVLLIAGDSFFLDSLAAVACYTHNVSVYVAEIRGFGYSGGKRGVARRREELWADCRSFVRHLRWNQCALKGIPLILAGHFWMAGLALNYVRWKEAEPVGGLLLAAPNFGRSAGRDVLRREMSEKLKQTEGVKADKFSLFLANLTGGRIGGERKALSMTVDESVLSINPMIVHDFSAGLLASWYSKRPAKQLRELEIPCLVVIGREDEFFVPERVKEMLGLNDQRSTTSDFHVIAGTNLSILCEPLADELNRWLASRTFPVQKTTEPADDSHEELTGKNKTSTRVLDNLRQLAKEAAENGVERYPLNYIESNDGLKLAFQSFRPLTYARGTAVLLFLAPVEFSVLLIKLAKQHGIISYRFDPRGTGKSGGRKGHISRKRELWGDISRMLSFVRLAFPGFPVFLGGIAVGAGVCLNYAEKREALGFVEPSGYVIFNPLVNPESPDNTSYTTDSLQGLFSIIRGGINIPFFRSHNHLVLDPEVSDLIGGFGRNYNSKYCQAMLCRSVKDQLCSTLESQIPAFVLLSRDFPLLNVELLAKQLPNSDHLAITTGGLLQTLEETTNRAGPWIVATANSLLTALPSLPIDATADLYEFSKADEFDWLEQLGRGTFGSVWLARHRHSSTMMAVKVLSKQSLIDKEMSEAALREREILSAVRPCKWAVYFYGSFQDRKTIYFAQEFLIGGELFTLMTRQGRLSLDSVKYYFAELALALDWLHTRGIVYRDIKPENILFDASGHTKLIDFGFSEVIGRKGRSTAFCGSPYYLAPELLNQSGGHDLRVDWWSAGVLLFEMLVGRPPFPGTTTRSVYRRILFYPGQAKKLLFASEAIDPDALDLINGLLQSNPDKRSTFKEVRQHPFLQAIDFEGILDGSQAPEVPAVESAADTANFPGIVGQGMTFEEWWAGLPDPTAQRPFEAI